MTKRFMLFMGDGYYPLGGMEDFVNSYDSFEEARKAMDKILVKDTRDWAHIYDTETKVIEQFRSEYDPDRWEPIKNKGDNNG
jgi:hypothetical protein